MAHHDESFSLVCLTVVIIKGIFAEPRPQVATGSRPPKTTTTHHGKMAPSILIEGGGGGGGYVLGAPGLAVGSIGATGVFVDDTKPSSMPSSTTTPLMMGPSSSLPSLGSGMPGAHSSSSSSHLTRQYSVRTPMAGGLADLTSGEANESNGMTP